MKNKKIFIIVLAYLFVTVPSCYIALEKMNSKLLIIILYALLSVEFVFSLLRMNSRFIKSALLQEKYNADNVLDDANAMIVIWSLDLSIANANEYFAMKMGHNKNNLMTKKILKGIVKKIFGNGTERLINMSDVQICAYKESKLIGSDGEEFRSFWKTNLIHNDKNTKIYMSVGIDKSDMTNMQNELSASESRYEMSMELSEVGLLYKQIGSDEYFMSKNLQNILGFESQNVSVSDFKNKIYPNDQTIYESYCKNSEERASEEIHKVTSIELRIQCSDGGYHWFNYRYKISNSFGGKSMAMGGSLIDISKDKEKDTLIEKMAYIDEITQIYNRNRFMLMGQETFACSKELALSYWLIIFDVDKFHIINDTCGYQNGNLLLKNVAITILKKVSDGGFCARIGGDNFAILIKDNGNDSTPLLIISEIQESLSSLSVGVFSNQTITASAGYCRLPIDGKDFSEILEHAEFALRLSENPRSNVVRYDNTVHDKILAKLTVEKELIKALANNQLKLFYQPKINLSTNQIIGAEALIRWIKPDGTIIPPMDFIPIAESSNLITKISEFVVNEACQQNKKWQAMGLPPINVSVNLSSVDFYQTDVCKTIKDAINLSGLKPEWLEVELTESLALKDVDQAIRQMIELKEIGIKISMDDFGTGYSSLSYIQVLPITVLKLDRSFIMYLENDEISREIVSAVINICKSKKIEIIAEGIETLGQADILRTAGCDLAQGYYFGRPMPSDMFEDFLRKAT